MSSAIIGSGTVSDFSIAGVGGTLLGKLGAGILVELKVGDLDWFDCSCDTDSSTLGGFGDGSFSADWTGAATGEAVDDDLIGAGKGGSGAEGLAPFAGPEGAGKGAMPTPLLSLAAAAAAAEAYFKVSPGGLVGIGAGFMLVSLGIGGGGGIALSCAMTGSGDFNCVEGLLVDVGSDFVFLMPPPSASCSS